MTEVQETTELCQAGRWPHEHLAPCGDFVSRGICGGPRVSIGGRIYHDDGSLCPKVNGPRPDSSVFGLDTSYTRWSIRGRE